MDYQSFAEELLLIKVAEEEKKKKKVLDTPPGFWRRALKSWGAGALATGAGAGAGHLLAHHFNKIKGITPAQRMAIGMGATGLGAIAGSMAQRAAANYENESSSRNK